jgi:hypothetical protein
MADTEDLKSSGPKARAGSSPALGILFSTVYRAGEPSSFTCYFKVSLNWCYYVCGRLILSDPPIRICCL